MNTDKSLNNTADPHERKLVFISILIIGFLFFVIGFVSWVNSILIPYFKIAFGLTNFRAYLVTFAFYISYFFMSMPAAELLKKTGFKKGIMWGLWIMSLGSFIFVPAALVESYNVFLIGLFVVGTGLSILQTAVNPYVTLMGSKERAAQRISITGIFNKSAGILAPLLFAAVILKSTDSSLFMRLSTMNSLEKNLALTELLRRVIIPYSVVTVILFIAGILINKSVLPEINTDKETPEINTLNKGKKRIWEFPHLVLGAVAIFLHVGTQVIAIDTIIGYAGTMRINLPEAKAFPSYTLFATICGYIIGIICIPKLISQLTALRLSVCAGIIFTMLILFTSGRVTFLNHTADVSIWFVALLGLSNALIWPGIWPLALNNLGRFTKKGSSLLIMGLSGNAILPAIYGYIGDGFGLRNAYWLLLPCYLYLLFYSVIGFRIKTWNLVYKSPVIPEPL